LTPHVLSERVVMHGLSDRLMCEKKNLKLGRGLQCAVRALRRGQTSEIVFGEKKD